MTSPGNSKANGTAKAAVEIVKRMMRKCKLQQEDPYLGLVSIRNTVNEGWHSSPAQRMFGTATKTLLPTTSSHLQSSIANNYDRDQANKRRAEEAQHFNHMLETRDLKPLQIGTSANIQPNVFR